MLTGSNLNFSGVHKMLSNLQDSELVISTSNLNLNKNTSVQKNQSYLFSRNASVRLKHHRNESSDSSETNVVNDSVEPVNCSDGNSDGYVATPLGSYLHSDKGIVSRTPVGRKNLGKYLQVSVWNFIFTNERSGET